MVELMGASSSWSEGIKSLSSTGGCSSVTCSEEVVPVVSAEVAEASGASWSGEAVSSSACGLNKHEWR